MERQLPNHCARRVLRYPALWGDDRLLTNATARRLIAAANERLGQGPPTPIQRRPYGASRAESWTRYRCPWLFCRTTLRDVAPDAVLRVAPGELSGHYEVVEAWRYRRDYRSLGELDELVEAFHRQLMRNRTAAVLNSGPTAPGSRRPAAGHRVAARPAGR
jgi:hypothetical protein